MEPPNERLKLASAEGEPLRLPPRLSCVAKSSVPCARRPGACSLSATPLRRTLHFAFQPIGPA